MNAAAQAIANTLSSVAGCAVEVTIRGERAFTFSTEQRNDRAAAKIAKFFAADKKATTSIEHDDECGSFVYLDIAN